MRVLAASIPGVTYAEAHLDIPFEQVWAYISDLESSMPALITDFRSFRITERAVSRGAEGEAESEVRLKAKAVGLLGNRGAFDVILKPGWCLMQSRLVIGGMAATPDGDGTRFAGCGALRLPGSALLGKAVGSRSAERIIARLRTRLD